jgi:hypothetical protein
VSRDTARPKIRVETREGTHALVRDFPAEHSNLRERVRQLETGVKPMRPDASVLTTDWANLVGRLGPGWYDDDDAYWKATYGVIHMSGVLHNSLVGALTQGEHLVATLPDLAWPSNEWRGLLSFHGTKIAGSVDTETVLPARLDPVTGKLYITLDAAYQENPTLRLSTVTYSLG